MPGTDLKENTKVYEKYKTEEPTDNEPDIDTDEDE